MYWGWLVLFIASGAIVYKIQKRKSGFWRYLFPSEIYQSQSVRDDFSIMLFYFVAGALLQVSLQSFLSLSLSQFVASTLGSPIDLSKIPFAVSFLAIALALDFGNFLSHLLMHKIDFLWQFHKVHHSALYLAPSTQFRSHPVEPLLKDLCMGITAGLVIGLLVAGGALEHSSISYQNLWLAYLIYYLTFHFRHSHLWISFGPYLSYIFSSPAMHQIHHSVEDRHRGKNLGIVFSFWDWMFGSLYIPKNQETFKIGLDDPDEQMQFQGLWNLWTQPFKNVFKNVFGWKIDTAASKLQER